MLGVHGQPMVLAVQGYMTTSSMGYNTVCGALVVIHSTNVNEYDLIYGEILNNLTN